MRNAAIPMGTGLNGQTLVENIKEKEATGCNYAKAAIRKQIQVINVREAKNLIDKRKIEWLDESANSDQEDFLIETGSEYKSDCDALDNCISEILKLTNDEKIIDLVSETRLHLCVNMK